MRSTVNETEASLFYSTAMQIFGRSIVMAAPGGSSGIKAGWTGSCEVGTEGNLIMKYLFALFLTLASFGTALAGSRDTTVTTVPFDFVIGSKTFPAGTYTISQISNHPRQGLHIQSSDGKVNALFLPTTTDGTISSDHAKLLFRHEGDKYFLTSVSSRSNTYTVTPRRDHPRTAEPENTVTVGAP